MQYGLLGYPLSHSFSQKYFEDKFSKLSLFGYSYQLFALETIEKFPELFKKNTTLKGLNVTIPYKQAVIPYLNSLAPSAQKVGAVNVIKQDAQGLLVGHNTDYKGFMTTLLNFLPPNIVLEALVLGQGGGAKAVQAVLNDLRIKFKTVGRHQNQSDYLYQNLPKEIIEKCQLIINTTPLGMYPLVDDYPKIPYNSLNSNHYLYDLVYNPSETLFLKFGRNMGAKVCNGLAMLHAQAEEAWRIWNETAMVV